MLGFQRGASAEFLLERTLPTSCVVIDYGLGNVYSVMQALRDFPVSCELTSDIAKIRSADRIILPGVGAFGRAADRLRALHLEEPLLEYVATGRPFLGICVGMQLLFDIDSEFGEHQGFGLIRGRVDRIDIADAQGRKLRVPLIGWHPLHPPNGDRSRWDGTPLAEVPGDSAFYFVHSFSARLADSQSLLAVTKHDGHEITAAVRKDNVLGTQFHPERSAEAGRAFLQSFMRI